MAKQKVTAPDPEPDEVLTAGDVFIVDGKTIRQAPPGPSLRDVIAREEKRSQSK